MGGEWGVGSSLALEKVPPRLRGLFGGLLMQGYSAGNLLAALCFFTLFDRWGWRPMFLLGGAPALLAIFVRMRVKESEVWKETKAQDWSHLWQMIVANRKVFLYILVLMTFMALGSHGTLDMYPTFLQRFWHLDPSRRAMISAIASIGAICGGIMFSWLSDSKGRKLTIVAGLLLSIAMIPLWAMAPNVALLAAGAFFINFMFQGAWGVIPAHLAELSPDTIRGFLVGLWTPVRRPDLGIHRCHSASAGGAHALPSRDGDYRWHRVRGCCRCDRTRQRKTRPSIWCCYVISNFRSAGGMLTAQYRRNLRRPTSRYFSRWIRTVIWRRRSSQLA